VSQLDLISVEGFRCQGNGTALGELLVCLIEHHTMKTCKEWKCGSTYCEEGRGGSEWPASRSGHCRADRAAGAEWLGSRLGPVVGLDTVSLH
jgi:hypothetical protein